MADNTTTPNKGLLKPIVGNSENTWGGYLNTTIDSLDSALGGTLLWPITTGYTLTVEQTVNTGYHFTGSLSDNAHINFPATYHGIAVVRNDTNQSLLCGTGGARATVPAGQTIIMWSDGVDFTGTAAGATTPPKMDASATIGTSNNWARADHIHPTDTKLLPKSGGTVTGDVTVSANLTVNNNLTAGKGGIKFTLPGTTDHAYAFGWTGTDLVAYVDGINVGQVAIQTAILPITGGVINGSLEVIGNLVCGDGRLICQNTGGWDSCVSAYNVNNNKSVGFWCHTDGTMWFGACDNTGAPFEAWMHLTSGGIAGYGPYFDLSDESSKLSIESSKVGLAEVMKLNPIRFRRKMPNGDPTEVEEIGFSASQVKKVIPEAVLSPGIIHGSDGLDSDNPSLGFTSEVIVAALVNAVKTLERRIKKLEKGNTSEPD